MGSRKPKPVDEALNELMRMVENNYEIVDSFPWNYAKQKPILRKCGDTLLEFLVLEIQSVYDPQATREANLAEVARIMRGAVGQLDAVAEAFEDKAAANG